MKTHQNRTQLCFAVYKINRSMQRPLFAAVLFRSLKKKNWKRESQYTTTKSTQTKTKTKAKRTKAHDDAKPIIVNNSIFRIISTLLSWVNLNALKMKFCPACFVRLVADIDNADDDDNYDEFWSSVVHFDYKYNWIYLLLWVFIFNAIVLPFAKLHAQRSTYNIRRHWEDRMRNDQSNQQTSTKR